MDLNHFLTVLIEKCMVLTVLSAFTLPQGTPLPGRLGRPIGVYSTGGVKNAIQDAPPD